MADTPIVLVTHDFPPIFGGIARYLGDLCRWLPRERLTVVAADSPGCQEFDASVGYRIVRVGVPQCGSMATRLFEVLALDRAVRRVSPRDACVVFGHLWVGLMSRLPGWAWRYALIPYGGEVQRLPNRVFAPVATGCSAALPISSYTTAECRQWGIPDSRIHLLRPGLDLSRLPQKPALPWERAGSCGPVLLTVGRLHERKGHVTVIEALARLRLRFPRLRYRIAGPAIPGHAIKEAVLRRASELGVADAVEFLGYVPDSELPRVYENADVFVMPSQTNQRSTEGFGLVFLEANYYGLPAVAWRSGGVSDSVVDNETGLLIPPGDIDGLTNALARLLEDPEFRFRLGRSGRDRVLREFDSRGVASEFAKVVESSMPLSAQEYRSGGGAR